MMRAHRRVLPWLLSLALLLGQLGLFVHAFAHLHEHDHESATADTVCTLCVAQAGLASALPSAACGISVATPRRTPRLSRMAHVHWPVPRIAHARAPPLLSVA
ncbi:MAG: hypothetical protein AB1593_01365 [Pseudomonadota bacterium]